MGIKGVKGCKAFIERGYKRHSSGMTLVEVMVSLAITGLIAMAAATIMTQTTQMGVQASNEASATEDIALFSQALHQYIDQAVYFMCNCNGARTGSTNHSCSFDQDIPDENTDACEMARQTTPSADTPNCAANTVATPPVSIVLAAFVTETAHNPLDASGVGCYMPPKWVVNVHHQPRGCKKVVQLRYTRPSREDTSPGGAASKPGVLELRDITAYASGFTDLEYAPLHVTATPYNTIAQLSNVTVARCGLMRERSALDGHALMNGFQLFAKLKILNRSVIASTKNNEPGVSSYNPEDTSYNSGKALTRRVNETFSFRNIEQRGRTYGPVGSRPCVADNMEASDWRDCCSGHLDAGNFKICGGDCLDSGVKPSHLGQCCSHMTSKVSGKCL